MKEQFEDFLLLVRDTIQTDHPTVQIATEKMEALLEKTDELAIEIIGHPIVRRGNRTLLETIAGQSKFRKLPNK